MLEVEEINNTNGLIEIADSWDYLLSESHSDNVFLTWEWVFNWWRVYEKNKELMILVVRSNREGIVAIAPFYLCRNKSFNTFWIDEVRFIGTGEDVSPDYLDIIIRKGHEKGSIRAIVRYLCNEPRWDVINLTDVLSTSSLAGTLKRLALINGLSFTKAHWATCPYINLPSSWEEYLLGLSKNTRYNVRRRMRNVERRFKTRYLICQKTDEVDYAIQKLSALHRKRWVGKKSSRSFATKEYNAFHQAVARDFAKKGWLQLSCLELDGDIVAIYYDYCYKNKIYYYQGGFNPSLYKYSPGIVLRAYVIQKAIERGLQEIDLLKGAYDHKYMWTSLNRYTVQLVIAKGFFTSKVIHFEKFTRNEIKAALKKIIPDSLLRVIKKRGIKVSLPEA
jgi:CelD/BcsL family acetyltransferase involved in cellulose biosynthesis